VIPEISSLLSVHLEGPRLASRASPDEAIARLSQNCIDFIELAALSRLWKKQPSIALFSAAGRTKSLELAFPTPLW
jgi:hypothetical protein